MSSWAKCAKLLRRPGLPELLEWAIVQYHMSAEYIAVYVRTSCLELWDCSWIRVLFL
jgi:hypothetical protein